MGRTMLRHGAVLLVLAGLSACGLPSSTNLYVAPPGVTPATGVTLTGFSGPEVRSSKDKDIICVAALDGRDVTAFRISGVDPRLLGSGTNDPNHCQSLAGFNYLLAPGAHSVTLSYWDYDGYRFGYGIPVKLDFTAQAGDVIRARRKTLGRTRSAVWLEDASGKPVSAVGAAQYYERDMVEFGDLRSDSGGKTILPVLEPEAIYAGPEIRSIAIEAALDTHVASEGPSFSAKIASDLLACQVQPRSQNADVRLKLAPLGYYYVGRKVDFDANDPKAPLPAWTNVYFDATLTNEKTKAVYWHRQIGVSYQPPIPNYPTTGENLAHAVMQRLAEDGYFPHCSLETTPTR